MKRTLTIVVTVFIMVVLFMVYVSLYIDRNSFTRKEALLTKLLDSTRLVNLYLKQEVQYYQNISEIEGKTLSGKKKNELAVKIVSMESQILERATDFESLKIVADNISVNSENLRRFPAIMPLRPGSYTRISSLFGVRNSPTHGASTNHKGIDIPAVRGTPVYAPADGSVESTNTSAKGYGKVIKMKHSFGFVTIYGHLSEILVKPKQQIKRGQVIGVVGSTGISTGPHLHYEILKNGNKIDPIRFTDILLNKFKENTDTE